MAEILPRHYLYGIILFTLIMIGGLSIVAEFGAKQPYILASNEYGEASCESILLQNNLLDSITNLNDNVQGEPKQSLLGWLNDLINKGWNILKSLGYTLSFGVSSMGGLSKILGVPAWIPVLLGCLVTVLIIFSILSAIFQKEI